MIKYNESKNESSRKRDGGLVTKSHRGTGLNQTLEILRVFHVIFVGFRKYFLGKKKKKYHCALSSKSRWKQPALTEAFRKSFVAETGLSKQARVNVGVHHQPIFIEK